MYSRHTVHLVALSVGVLYAGGPAFAQGKGEPAAVIATPEDGGTVTQTDEVEGRLNTRGGWPVVVVQPPGGEPWWVQPPVEEVRDGSFTALAHFGADEPPGAKFRIIIVVAKTREDASRFTAGTTSRSLPPDLPRSAIITVTRGAGARAESPPSQRTITFSGREWEVKTGDGKLGPGPNYFSNTKENVRLDAEEHLHLAITQHQGRWQCAEVVAPKSLGYGEYRWVISGDLAALDPRVILGLFLYEDDRHEIDFELARWGSRNNANAQFVVQPTAKDSMHRFDTGKAPTLTCSLVWKQGIVRGRCWVGEDTTQKPLADWSYTGRKVPRPGRERARANLWLLQGRAPTGSEKQEVVIRSFHFEAPGRGENPGDGAE